jgi:hypothetical protein
MIKTIIQGPTPERRLRNRMGFRGVRVVGGSEPNGMLPVAIGSGIFGAEGQDEGIFNGFAGPHHRPEGVFFDNSAGDNYEYMQPDIDWTLVRRPGAPLYPGSSAHGIVLVGPSMGLTTAEQAAAGTRAKWWLAGCLALAAFIYFAKRD